jgi:E3 SUMO-protein ligase NSE2
MPRNRRRVVDAMSDHIEEDDDASQRPEVDAVDADEQEEEERQSRPPRKKLSRSAKGQSSKSTIANNAAETEREEEDAQDDDATPVFGEDEIGNKPLSRHDGQKLQGMASDWNMIETNLKESAFSLLTEVSTAVAEYADDDTAEKVITLRSPPFTHAHVEHPHAGIGEAGRSHEGDNRH